MLVFLLALDTCLEAAEYYLSIFFWCMAGAMLGLSIVKFIWRR